MGRGNVTGPQTSIGMEWVSEDALFPEMACLLEIIFWSLTVGGTLWDQVAADCRINLLV